MFERKHWLLMFIALLLLVLAPATPVGGRKGQAHNSAGGEDVFRNH